MLLPNALAAACVAFIAPTYADDLTKLSDEFDDPASLSDWHRVYQTEGWGADQLESIDIGSTREGRLTLVPRASSWYQDWRGALVYKNVQGDFVATMQVEPRNLAGDGPPGSLYSLAGIMARMPRDEMASPDDWNPNRENYLFLSLGMANDPGAYQFEVETTFNSSSNLSLDSGSPSALLQIARVGDVFIVLRQLEGEAWEVHRRYYRSDMPDTVQVGMIAYTDWETAQDMDALQHNQTASERGTPDLRASVDYFRFSRPWIPPSYQDADFLDPYDVTDGELVALFGDRMNRTVGDVAPRIVDLDLVPGSGLRLLVDTDPGFIYELYQSEDLENWQIVHEERAYYETLELQLDESRFSEGALVRVGVRE
ncbi:hypothetical protein [Pelagicoccus sp. SDUM812003]|uniref:hypothetical protein n=1 Tax=Pelagicoccus sp. SDUM812003 TaxID=3041267 RepID=UPI00280F253E|nr:hypothetical protein [Pelagicoccus sp. SDUM812003]MDQ8202144.1 hypothetical protein [Pelagicoccus sp. SDUM812003]